MSNYMIIGNNSKLQHDCKNLIGMLVHKYSGCSMMYVGCIISYYHVLDTSVKKLDYSKIEKMIENMKIQGGGRLVIIVNHTGDSVRLLNKSEIYGEQNKLISWIKSKILEWDKYKIIANFIDIGYCTYLEENILDLEPWLIIKRKTSLSDIYYSLKFLLDENNTYIVGQTIRINGGIDINPLKPVFANKLSTVKVENNIKSSRYLVVGASSGIGKRTAYHLCSEGANVILFARRLEELKRIKEDLESTYKVNVEVCGVDVTDEEILKHTITRVYEEAPIQGLIYSTGSFDGENMLDSNVIWKKIWKTNMEGYRTAVSTYIECCKKAKLFGNIVGVSSVGGIRVLLPGLEAYGISKRAMIQFSKAVALNYSRYGIRINCVAPGWIDSPMSAFLDEKYKKLWLDKMINKRPGNPNDVSLAIKYLISNESANVTGSTICIDGGITLGRII